MTIETTRPEIETSAPEALQASGKPLKDKTFSELFAPLRGLDLGFSPDEAPGLPFDL